MTIEHDAARRRFTTRLPSGEAYLSYQRPRPGVLDLQHTIVPEAEQGRGVGDSLVRHAIGYARDNGERVIPTCPFVESWLAKHPEEADVVDES
jgi:predicted GNAT family acetyltransferase